MAKKASLDASKLDKIVADAQKAKDLRQQSYREQALKLFPWICGRCSREFDAANLRELTVHHKDHNHDNNPPDGSNWELLCLYCHDNEHSRYLDAAYGEFGAAEKKDSSACHSPFADLGALLKNKQ